MNISIKFAIKKNKSGKIKFTLLHNKKRIFTDIITSKKNKKINLSIKEKDKLVIIADKSDNALQDHGILKIEVLDKNSCIRKYTIPFLFSLFIIFLIRKNYIYIGILSYIIYIIILISEKINFGKIPFNNALTYLILIFSINLIFIYINQKAYKIKKIKFLTTILTSLLLFTIYIIPLLFIIYYINSNVPVTKDCLYAIFQSNINESYEYISDYIQIKYLILFFLINFIILFFIYKQKKLEPKKTDKQLLLLIIIIFINIFITQFQDLRFPNFIIENFNKYKKELELFKEIEKKRKTGEIEFNAFKNSKGETYIIIIGESLNKNHMGIYDYIRNTTPNLYKFTKEENNTIIFNNIYANHTHTMAVLSLSLTEANQYNKKSYYSSLSIIDILKKSNIKTYWLTNQVLYGGYDNLVSIIAHSSDYLEAINFNIGATTKISKYDGELINKVKKILLKKTQNNRVIFIHLMGNHTRYSLRYPKNYEKFKGKLDIGKFGIKASKNKKINSYDNSVLYNDYVVSSILKELKNTKGINGLIYISDHGEDVINKRGHNSSRFSYQMIQIPMIIWLNKNFIKKYPDKFNNLKNRKESLFSNDLLYDTIIGLLNIKTNKYNSKYDLTSKNYELKEKNALILHGKLKYTNENNYIYWQKQNIQYLIDTNQSNRIIPLRVNSIGKLRSIWKEGFKSFELDIIFDSNNSKLKVGYDKEIMGKELEIFLKKIDFKEIQKICFDLKNLKENNYKIILNKLEKLDKKFNLKHKIILESETTKEFFKIFSKKNWYTSYCLPTKKILKVLKQKNEEEIKKISSSIINQISIQKIRAISFDKRLYSFVKKYLEPKIDKNITYHIWTSPQLIDPNFKIKIFKDKIYKDKRINTILAPYKSYFEL